jgi:hypothetical protein
VRCLESEKRGWGNWGEAHRREGDRGDFGFDSGGEGGGGSPVSYLMQRVTGGRAALRALEPREKWCWVRKGGDDGSWAFLKPARWHWDRGGRPLTRWPEAAV